LAKAFEGRFGFLDKLIIVVRIIGKGEYAILT
jgi:hypothetical protein